MEPGGLLGKGRPYLAWHSQASKGIPPLAAVRPQGPILSSEQPPGSGTEEAPVSVCGWICPYPRHSHGSPALWSEASLPQTPPFLGAPATLGVSSWSEQVPFPAGQMAWCLCGLVARRTGLAQHADPDRPRLNFAHPGGGCHGKSTSRRSCFLRDPGALGDVTPGSHSLLMLPHERPSGWGPTCCAQKRSVQGPGRGNFLWFRLQDSCFWSPERGPQEPHTSNRVTAAPPVRKGHGLCLK